MTRTYKGTLRAQVVDAIKVKLAKDQPPDASLGALRSYIKLIRRFSFLSLIKELS